jgi:hypothetical protein
VSRVSERELLIQDLESLLVAAKHTRQSITEVERRTRRMIRIVQNQGTIQELLSSFEDPAGTATEVTAVLDLFEGARLQTRRRIVHMAQSEGVSLARLAKFWGISRQRVSRFAQESR